MTKIRFVHTPPGPRGRIAKPWTYRHQCDVFPNLMANRHLTVATIVILRETYFSKRGRIQAKPERVRILHLTLVPKLSLGTKAYSVWEPRRAEGQEHSPPHGPPFSCPNFAFCIFWSCC